MSSVNVDEFCLEKVRMDIYELNVQVKRSESEMQNIMLRLMIDFQDLYYSKDSKELTMKVIKT